MYHELWERKGTRGWVQSVTVKVCNKGLWTLLNNGTGRISGLGASRGARGWVPLQEDPGESHAPFSRSQPILLYQTVSALYFYPKSVIVNIMLC